MKQFNGPITSGQHQCSLYFMILIFSEEWVDFRKQTRLKSQLIIYLLRFFKGFPNLSINYENFQKKIVAMVSLYIFNGQIQSLSTDIYIFDNEEKADSGS